MSKKNRHRHNQYNQPRPTPAPPPPPRTEASVNAATTAETAQRLGELTPASHAALDTVGADPIDETSATVAPGLKLEEALAQAVNAQRRFVAALTRCESLQKEIAEHKRALDQEREESRTLKRELDEALGRLARDRRELDERREQITAREQDAELGFVALRGERLGAIHEEYAKLLTEIERQRSALANERTTALGALRQELDALAQKARYDDASRAREASDAIEKTTAEAHRHCTSLLDTARRGAEALRAEAAKEGAQREQALDERERDLRDREAALRTAQRWFAEERKHLDEDREDLDAKIERRAGQALADAREQIEDLRRSLDAVKKTRDAYEARFRALEAVESALAGRSPAALIEELTALRAKNAELTRELDERPSAATLDAARETERALAEAREQNYAQRRELAEQRTRFGRLEVAAVELETLRAQKEAQETSRGYLLAELDRLQTEYGELTKRDEAKHPLKTLCDLDVKHAQATSTTRLADATLQDFARDLRTRLVTALDDRRLYYSDRDVRCFLGGMAMSRLMLLQGISGTGKTSLPTAVAKALGGDHEIVEVQAGWRDKNDLLGFYNAFHKHFYAQNFLQAFYRAGTPEFSDRVSFIVLDEINLSRVEQFFAEFLSVLEKPREDQRITLMDQAVTDPPKLLVEGRHLRLPRNVWFVGTANHDETTTAFADKTYDRAHVMELPRHPRQDASGPAPTRRDPIALRDLEALFDRAKKDHPREAERAAAWLVKSPLAPTLGENFGIAWGNRLERDIASFVPVVCAAGGSVGEALDHLLATKVLRKLRGRYDVRTDGLERVHDILAKEWVEPNAVGDSGAMRSLELVSAELRAKRNGVSA